MHVSAQVYPANHRLKLHMSGSSVTGLAGHATTCSVQKSAAHKCLLLLQDVAVKSAKAAESPGGAAAVDSAVPAVQLASDL